MPKRNPNLIFDIGASNGTDTQFYLDKGFDVVAVEADPVMYEENLHRFKTSIVQGRLQMLNRAARLETQALERRLAVFLTLLEPLMILTMGAVVLMIVLAILLPIIEINQLVR